MHEIPAELGIRMKGSVKKEKERTIHLKNCGKYHHDSYSELVLRPVDEDSSVLNQLFQITSDKF